MSAHAFADSRNVAVASAHRPNWAWLMAAGLGVLVASPESAPAQSRDPYAVRRSAMVDEYIKKEGVTSKRVLDAMRQTPRHEFVPPSLRAVAYYDQALAIGFGQTISPPFIVAYMTETIDPRPDDRVLEIGTGSGYQAAVLSGLVKDVYTIEIVELLGLQAREKLRTLGYENVHVKVGDGYLGWPDYAPFDKIIVTCSPESVPTPLVEQLREGGQMLIPLGERYQQVFYLFEKRDGELVKKRLQPTLFVPMTGRSEKEREVLPDPLNPRILNGDFEQFSKPDGRLESWHYQRRATVKSGGPQGASYLSFQNSEAGRTSQILQGMAVDGRRVSALKVGLHVRTSTIVSGRTAQERPGMIIHYYDVERRPVGESVIGPWTRNHDWRRLTEQVPVPAGAHEAIIQIGLNGATGELCVDDLQLTAVVR